MSNIFVAGARIGTILVTNNDRETTGLPIEHPSMSGRGLKESSQAEVISTLLQSKLIIKLEELTAYKIIAPELSN